MASTVLALSLSLLSTTSPPLPRPTYAVGEDPEPKVPPNIILIVLDDVGVDKLAFYPTATIATGGGWDQPGAEDFAETPVLQAIHDAGVRFDHAYATPLCTPTRAQLLSGGYGHQTGAVYLGATLPITGVPGSSGLLPRTLSRSDYRTGAFGKWHLTANLTDYCHPFDCGFAVFQGHMENNSQGSLASAPMCVTSIVRDHYKWDYVSVDALPSTGSPLSTCPSATTTTWSDDLHWDAKQTTQDARAFIDRFGPGQPREGERFFAYVAINTPHQYWQLPPRESISADVLNRIKAINADPITSIPWSDSDYDANAGFGLEYSSQCAECPSDTLSGYKRRLYYRAMLESTDYYIGQMLGTTSKQVTDLANTIVLVVGDNGTPVETMQVVAPDPGVPSPGASGAPYPSGHSKREVYELGINVPLLAYGPSQYVATGSCEGLVSTVDFWATINELTGTVPAFAPAHTTSFTYWLLDPAGANSPTDPVREFVYQEVSGANDVIWDGTNWTDYTVSPPAVVTSSYPMYFRAVIDQDGWKHILRRTVDDCGGSACVPCVSATLPSLPSSATQSSCAMPSLPNYQFFRVFGDPAAQPNEIVQSVPSVPIARALRCAMYTISGP